MIELFPQPEPRKPTLLHIGKSEYQFPMAAKEIYILNDRGQTLWKAQRLDHKGPIRWRGVDSEGHPLATGDYVCHLVYPDGQNVYITFLFAA